MPNCQWPMTNCQSNLYWIRYILQLISSPEGTFCGTFIVHEHYFPKLLLCIVVFVVDQYRWNPHLTPGLIYEQPANQEYNQRHVTAFKLIQTFLISDSLFLLASVYNWPRIHYLNFDWQLEPVVTAHLCNFLSAGPYCSLKITFKNFLDPAVGAEPPELFLSLLFCFCSAGSRAL